MVPRAVVLAMLFAAAASAQSDLPPGVLLLSKIKRHMKAEVERLPDYTCLQTVARFRSGLREKNDPRPSDVMVLEVLNAGNKEMYASPGARGFRDTHPGAFAAGGMTGSGMFGLLLRNLFVNDNAMSQYKGEEEVGGRRAVRYDFRIPVTLSGYTVQMEFASGRVGMKGSFWADPESLDLLWLESEADDIPPKLQVLSLTQSIDYARTQIGERAVILPQSARMRMLETDGKESKNVVEFTHCRSFTAESKLSFDAAPAGGEGYLPPAAEAPRPEQEPVPPGLMVALELLEPITDRQVVGGSITARVADDVLQKRKVVLPRGAMAHGRIRRLERQQDYSLVAIEFTDIETPGGAVRFYANFEDMQPRFKQILRTTTTTRGPRRQMVTDTTWAPYLPGVVQFFVDGSDLLVPKGFRTVWKTTSPRAPFRLQ